MADDQQPPAQRYWFPYWTAPPQPPPPVPAPRPAVRPQLSRRDTRPAPPTSSPPVTPSPSRRQSHPQPATTPASRGAGGAPSPPAQPQSTRLSSRPSPSPSPARAPPLSPIREPNASAAPAPVPVLVAKESKPAATPHPTAHEVPKQKDIIIPQEKTIREPPADSKHSKAVEKEKEEREREKDKQKKEEDKEKKKKEEEKEKEEKKKEHKEKEKEKVQDKKKKEHKEKKEKDKEEIKSKEAAGEHGHGSKLHKELKSGVADMVHKLSASAPSSGGGHGRPTPAAAGTTVITLAGENKGASMKIDGTTVADGKADSASGKERRGHKLNGSVAGGKERAGSKGPTAFVNSNVQVINNSLLLQSSCNGGDPGVHLKLATKSKKKGDGREEAGGKSGSAAAPKK
ncbi:hypothetical protein PAHAL_5G442000 [Panicum hallii]|jgi:hypothetical protein|uniref:Uncharacterized protein n=1 Tax=Panicum hallii TaxID=206008 RepID=A0A2T8IN74_9POAL|nr:chromatin assembly factor 1 subunit A-like [Panicum hallii]PVH39120.1 hypothetical protein PAHAL_5G442000 [Panicum hallii]